MTKVDADRVYLEAEGKPRVFPRGSVLKVKFVRQWRVPGEDEPAQIAAPALQGLLAAPPKPADYPSDGYITWFRDTTVELHKDKSYTVTVRTLRHVLRERGKSPAS